MNAADPCGKILRDDAFGQRRGFVRMTAAYQGAELLLHLRREKERVHNIQPQRQVQKLGAVFHNSVLRRVQHLVIDGGKIAVRTQRAALDHSKKCKFPFIVQPLQQILHLIANILPGSGQADLGHELVGLQLEDQCRDEQQRQGLPQVLQEHMRHGRRLGGDGIQRTVAVMDTEIENIENEILGTGYLVRHVQLHINIFQLGLEQEA